MDKVSIVVPVYNVAPYLRRCLDSLVNQTYPRVEVIAVDDCSSDGSPAIAAEYAERYPDRCRFLQREKNGGLSAARNTGIAAAKGDWISFVDSDDWVSEDFIQSLTDAALRESADIVMSNFLYAYPSGVLTEVSTFGDLTSASSHKDKVAFADPCATTRLYRRSLFSENAVSFPEDILRAEDIATVIPLLTYTDKIALLPKAMYYYFQRSSSLSNRNGKDTDVSFYPKTVARMLSLSRPGFETEVQFRAIHEWLYGLVMIMVRAGKSREEVASRVDEFCTRFPDWRDNPYLQHLPLAKRLFIKAAAKKRYGLLKCFIFAWDCKQRLFARQQG